MTYTITSTKASFLRQYAFRWLFVPRLWQRFIRYFGGPLLLVTIFATQVFPEAVRTPLQYLTLGLLGFYYLLPFVDALMRVTRSDFKDVRVTFDFDAHTIVYQSESAKTELAMTSVVHKKLRPRYSVLTVKNTPHNLYLYFFKESIDEGKYEDLLADLKRIEISAATKSKGT